MKHLVDPMGTKIVYLGPDQSAGALPAFFYFALSGEESLELSPYNTPAALLYNSQLRIYSLTLPGHGAGYDKRHAMQEWANHFIHKQNPFPRFFQQAQYAVNWLIEQKLIDPAHLAVGGLSRGGFIATHLAAYEKRIHTVLGFAPLTKLSQLKELQHNLDAQQQEAAWDLEHLTDRLINIKNLRFYIGNRDTRVSTDACFHFVRQLADHAYLQHRRQIKIELIISQSIGQHGHGTDPSIFKAGIDWLKPSFLM